MKEDPGHYYVCDHFVIQEFVPEIIYLYRGEKAWQLIDHHLLENYDSLREQLGTPVRLNNWHQKDGTKQWQGLRLPEAPDYRLTSQHSYARAGDSSADGISAEEIRTRIQDREIILPHPCTIEVGVPWLHMDTRQSTDLITFVDTEKVVWRYSD